MRLTKKNIEEKTSLPHISYAFIIDVENEIYYYTEDRDNWSNFFNGDFIEVEKLKSLEWKKTWCGRTVNKMSKKLYKITKKLEY